MVATKPRAKERRGGEGGEKMKEGEGKEKEGERRRKRGWAVEMEEERGGGDTSG